jgi:hypothetical protein
MKKVSRQQLNRERQLDRNGGLRTPKHQPTKRSAAKREERDAHRRIGTSDED